MGEINKLARQTLDQVSSHQGVSNVTPKPADPFNAPVSNLQAFARVMNQKQPSSILESNLLEGPLQQYMVSDRIGHGGSERMPKEGTGMERRSIRPQRGLNPFLRKVPRIELIAA